MLLHIIVALPDSGEMNLAKHIGDKYQAKVLIELTDENKMEMEKRFSVGRENTVLVSYQLCHPQLRRAFREFLIDWDLNIQWYFFENYVTKFGSKFQPKNNSKDKYIQALSEKYQVPQAHRFYDSTPSENKELSLSE